MTAREGVLARPVRSDGTMTGPVTETALKYRIQFADRMTDATGYLDNASAEIEKAIQLSKSVEETDQLFGVKAIIRGTMDVLSGMGVYQ